MYRRFLVTFFRRSFVVLLLICLGCAAQSAPTDLTQKIENQVRAFYKIPADVKITVGPLHASEFPNYDATTISLDGEGQNKVFEFLVSKDQKTLVRLTKIDMTSDPYLEVMKKIDLANRPVRGNNDAKVVVVNFDDFQCPFCSRMHQVLFPEIFKEYGDRVKFVYKDYPLMEIHPWAKHAAIDANCLAAQSSDAYWSFADYIHANQHQVAAEKAPDGQFKAVDRITTEQGQKFNVDQAKLQSCIKAQNDSAVKASMKEGELVGVTATPTLFINGQEIDGALPIDEVRATLDQALTRAGVPVPKHTATEPSTPDKPKGE
jgi:protein-disulfide isomerase